MKKSKSSFILIAFCVVTFFGHIVTDFFNNDPLCSENTVKSEEVIALTYIDEDSEFCGMEYCSDKDNENALFVESANVKLSKVKIEKTDNVKSDNETKTYKNNAALLVMNQATVGIIRSEISSTARSGTGVLGYSAGTKINIYDSSISTKRDNSCGVYVAGGATVFASEVQITTFGNCSMPICTDNSDSLVIVNGGKLISNGADSPVIYSAASISAMNTELIANASEVIIVEGNNNVILENCHVKGNLDNPETYSTADDIHNIILFRNLTTPLKDSTSVFSMAGGSILTNKGNLFYVTNTNCTLSLSNVEIINNDPDSLLLLVRGYDESLCDGGNERTSTHLNFYAYSQELKGNIQIEDMSSLNMILTNGSIFTGAINISNSSKNTSNENEVVISIQKGCVWNLAGDSTVSKISNEGAINYNGFKITLADGTVLKN